MQEKASETLTSMEAQAEAMLHTEIEDDYGVDDDLLASVRGAIEAEDTALIRTLVEPLHAADIAELLTNLREDERYTLTTAMRDVLNPEVLVELSPELQDEVIETLGPLKSAEAIAQLDTDDAVYVIEGLEADNQREILAAMTDEEQKTELEEGLAYPDSSAGRLMQTEFVSVPEFWTVGDTIDFLRRADDLPNDFYAIMVVDPRYKPIGSVLLSRIMRSTRDTSIRSIMYADIKRIPTEMDQEQIAYLFRKYGLVETPVVHPSGRLVGVITVDDVVDVIAEEDKEDFEKIGGVEALDDPYLNTPLLTLVKKRTRWLVVLFLGEMLTASAMGHFEEAITQLVVLTLFIPLIISSGGNSGSQAATLVIRAMALGEVRLKDWWRVMQREISSGLMMGLILGAIGFAWIAVRHHLIAPYGADWVLLGLTVSLALVGVVMWGTITGSMLPFIMRKLGADPATSSTPFVATLVDVTGLIIYFTVASLLLLS
jgi:magnesium transporter